jgi:hypothetical protein
MITKAQRAQWDHKVCTKTTPFPIEPTNWKRIPDRLSANSTIMIVVNFAKVSALHQRVVISSLAKQLEKPPFCHSYTSIGAWPRDHYMPLQRTATEVHHALLRILQQRALVAVLRISQQRAPLAPCSSSRSQSMSHVWHKEWCTSPLNWARHTQPIAFQISKQAVPYQTRDGTCCPRVSTPRIWSIADLSTTCDDGFNHLHHSNHNIDCHTIISHLNGWKTTTLS